MTPVIDAETISVINLDRCVDRMEAFLERNAHLGPVRRLSAVVGASVDRAALRARDVIADGIDYTDGALGCALSHFLLWREAAGGTRALTVCEDDAVLAADFIATANARLAALPDGWDLVLWGWNFNSSLVMQILPGLSSHVLHLDKATTGADLAAASRAPASAQLFRLERACGTLCYTISPRGAARLLGYCVPLRPVALYIPEDQMMWANCGIDLMMSSAYPHLQAYVSVPPLAVTPNIISSSTTR